MCEICNLPLVAGSVFCVQHLNDWVNHYKPSMGIPHGVNGYYIVMGAWSDKKRLQVFYETRTEILKSLKGIHD